MKENFTFLQFFQHKIGKINYFLFGFKHIY